LGQAEIDLAFSISKFISGIMNMVLDSEKFAFIQERTF